MLAENCNLVLLNYFKLVITLISDWAIISDSALNLYKYPYGKILFCAAVCAEDFAALNSLNFTLKGVIMDKKILTIQDLSCVGQCSLTVALPILSAYGFETCVLPTAVLSNHTMFKKWSYLDLTPEVENIYSVWKENGFKFDAFLLGYLGKAPLMDAAERAFDIFAADNKLIVIDPVFADNGKLYGGFDMEYVKGMAHLIRRADIILPNLTEACYLTGTPWRASYDYAFVEEVVAKLRALTDATAVVTGVELDGCIGEAICSDGEKISYTMGEKLPVSKHGTGDIFASVFTAEYLGGASLRSAAMKASSFVKDCLRATPQEHFYGVVFEKILAAQRK